MKYIFDKLIISILIKFLLMLPSSNKRSENVQEENVKIWEAAYINKNFYFAEPKSITKLRQLQKLINQEKKKLQPNNITFQAKQSHQLSVRSYSYKNKNNIDGLHGQDSKTQLNQSKLIQKNNQVEEQLAKQETKFKNNIQKIKQRQSEEYKLEQKKSKQTKINTKNNEPMKTSQQIKLLKSQKKQEKKLLQSEFKNNTSNNQYSENQKQQPQLITTEIKNKSKHSISRNIIKQMKSPTDSREPTPRFKIQDQNNLANSQIIEQKNTKKQNDNNLMSNQSNVSNTSKAKTNMDIVKLNSKITELQQSLIKLQSKQKQFQKLQTIYRQQIDKTIINERQARKQLNMNSQSPQNHHNKSQQNFNKTVNFIGQQELSSGSINKMQNNFGIISSVVNINTAEQIQRIKQKQQEEREKQKMKDQIANLKKNVRQLTLQRIKQEQEIQNNKKYLQIRLQQEREKEKKRIIIQEETERQNQKQKANSIEKWKKDKEQQLKLKQQRISQESNVTEQMKSKQNLRYQSHTLKEQVKIVQQAQQQLNISKDLPNPIFLRNINKPVVQILPVTLASSEVKQQFHNFPKFKSISIQNQERVNVGKIIKNSVQKNMPSGINGSSMPKKQFNIRVTSIISNNKGDRQTSGNKIYNKQQELIQKKQINPQKMLISSRQQNLQRKQEKRQKTLISNLKRGENSEILKNQNKHQKTLLSNLKFSDTNKSMAIKKSQILKQQFERNRIQVINNSTPRQKDLKDKRQISSLSKMGILVHQMRRSNQATSQPKSRMYTKDNYEEQIVENKNRQYFLSYDNANTFDVSKDEGKKIFELEFKKKNDDFEQSSQEQTIKQLPEVKLEGVQIVNIPNPPNQRMSAEQMMSIASEAFEAFGVKIPKSLKSQQIKMIKFKNCVLFRGLNVLDKILWHYSGKFYFGGWKDDSGQGNKSGQGYEYFPEKNCYRGQFLQGKKNGKGKMSFANGSIYDGQWLDGNRHGQGKFLDTQTKTYYDGQWKENKKDGFGTLRINHNVYYIGTFFKSVKSGFGIQAFTNGDKYKGQYLNNKFHGKGKYVWANGSWYEGKFFEGVRSGKGKWKSGKNGDCYIGQYQKDKKHGYGKYIWANGYQYEGNFENDLKQGDGIMTYDNGKEVKGIWVKGQLKQIKDDKVHINSRAATFDLKIDGTRTIDISRLNPQRMPKIKTNNLESAKHLTNHTIQFKSQQKQQLGKSIGKIIDKPSRQVEKSNTIGKF